MKIIRINPMIRTMFTFGVFAFPVIIAVLMLTLRELIFCILLGIVLVVLEAIYIYAIVYMKKWCIEFDETHFTFQEMSKVICADYGDVEKVSIIDETRNGVQFNKRLKITLRDYPHKVIEVTIDKNSETHKEFLELITTKTREGVCDVRTVSR